MACTSGRNEALRPLGRLELGKLTPTDVERLTADLMGSGRWPRTAALTRVVLRRALADAERDGLVHRNVAAPARPPHVPAPDERRRVACVHQGRTHD
jgi:hypothetical protein